MKITYWTVSEYWKETGYELQNRGYDIQFNKLDENTDLVLVIGATAAFDLLKYLGERHDTERFMYKGKIAMCVLDIPLWRFTDEYFFEYYTKYRDLLKSSHEILTISEFTSTQLKKLWELDSKPLLSIFNDKMVKKYRKEMPRQHKIVAVGRFVNHKAFQQLIIALEGTDYKLVLIGKNGHLEKQYEDMAKDLKVDLEIRKDISDKELIEEYCSAEVVIHPSVFEGLSLVQKEALMCGTPVLHSDIPVHVEFHGDKVATFKANDIEDLKKAIKEKRWETKKVDTKHLECLMIDKKSDEIEKWLKKILKD